MIICSGFCSGLSGSLLVHSGSSAPSRTLLPNLLVSSTSTCALRGASHNSLPIHQRSISLRLLTFECSGRYAKGQSLPYYHVHIVISCCMCALIVGRICATYQIFASRHDCTYCTLWVRHNNLAYVCRACARTAVVMCQG